jgi:hypothetical protein
MVLVPSALTSICVVLPVTSALCYDFLNKLKEDIQQVREMNYESSVEFLREIARDIEENLGTQAIKVKLEKAFQFFG